MDPDALWYDPAPVTWLPAELGAAGLLRARPSGDPAADRRAALDALPWLARSPDPRAAALRREVRSLAVVTSVKEPAGFDLRDLAGLDALERLVVQTHAGGVRGLSALRELPALRELTLYACGRNRIDDLAELPALPGLRTLRLWWGSVGDLRPLRGLAGLRALSVRENAPLSLRGIERLAIEELDLWLPRAPCDLGAIESLPALRALSLAGLERASQLAPLRHAPIGSLSLRGDVSLDVFARLPLAEEVRLEAPWLDLAAPAPASLPLTSLDVGRLGAQGLRALARAPRLRALRVHRLDAPDLAPLAGHPSLRALSFRRAPLLRSLDDVPACEFSRPLRAPEGPVRMTLAGSPLASVRGLHRLRGVGHLDLRHCASLRSLEGLAGMPDLRTVDLRGLPRDADLRALAGVPTLRAVMLNHLSPRDGELPEALRPLARRAHLRGMVRRGAP